MQSEGGHIASFVDTIRDLLKQGNTLNAITIFTDNKNSSEVFNNSWDLVPVVAEYLTEEHEINNIEVFKCSEKLIAIITEQSKPEEVLLQFIQEIEEASDDTKFIMLVRPLEKVLLRVPEKRVSSLGWCFSAITGYLKKVETPQDFNLNEEERLLIDCSDCVSHVIYLYSELDHFYETFVQELQCATGNILERRKILQKFLVELLGPPLGNLCLELYKTTKSRPRLIAENIIKNLSKITPDLLYLLEMSQNDNFNNFSLGTLYYLVLSEQVICQLPQVYNPIFVFQKIVRFIVDFFTHENQFVVERGVKLTQILLSSINRLPSDILDCECQVKFCISLSNLVVYNRSENLRKEGLKILRSYMWYFDPRGRFLLIFNLFQKLTHSGLKGWIITQYKEMVMEELQNQKGEVTSNYYQGRKLFDLLTLFTFMKEKEESDLVDNSDQIVSTLNFLRSIVIADKKANTFIDYILPNVEEEYLTYLRMGIEMSREHYKLDIKKLGEGKGERSDCQVSMTVSGKDLLEMPREKKIEIMNMSLTTLDMIDSLLARLVECIEFRQNNHY